MNILKNAKRIVFKVGTSTLTYETGRFHLQRMEEIVRILSDFINAGKQVILVSSGAVGAGLARLGISERPKTTEEKQAAAAVGQNELMRMYDHFFGLYGQKVAQILMTKDSIDFPERRSALENTFLTLLNMGCVPIVNENDSISVEGLKFGGNDTLSAYVALACHADVLVNLSDVDGLYTQNPRTCPDAALIPIVKNIDEVLSAAGGAGTERGTGGMLAKLNAAKIVCENNIPMFIVNGTNPHILYDLMEGKQAGTYFMPC